MRPHCRLNIFQMLPSYIWVRSLHRVRRKMLPNKPLWSIEHSLSHTLRQAQNWAKYMFLKIVLKYLNRDLPPWLRWFIPLMQLSFRLKLLKTGNLGQWGHRVCTRSGPNHSMERTYCTFLLLCCTFTEGITRVSEMTRVSTLADWRISPIELLNWSEVTFILRYSHYFNLGFRNAKIHCRNRF